MLALKMAGLIIAGLASGLVTATGLFALISSIGLINRYADVTVTKGHLVLYEEMIIMGAGLGNIWFIFGLPLHIGVAGLVIYGLVSGIFIGTFLLCLAETVKALPILTHRVRIRRGLGFVILFIAVGKCVGHLIYYLIAYA